MHSFLSNLELFAQLMFRVSVLCGFGVSVPFVSAAETWAKAFRVPARKRSWNVVSWPRAKSLRVGTHPIGSQFGDAPFRDVPSRKKVRKA